MFKVLALFTIYMLINNSLSDYIKLATTGETVTSSSSSDSNSSVNPSDSLGSQVGKTDSKDNLGAVNYDSGGGGIMSKLGGMFGGSGGK